MLPPTQHDHKTGIATMRKTSLRATLLASALAVTSAAQAADKPASLNLGIFTFLSGPAAAYGVPGEKAAKLTA